MYSHDVGSWCTQELQQNSWKDWDEHITEQKRGIWLTTGKSNSVEWFVHVNPLHTVTDESAFSWNWATDYTNMNRWIQSSWQVSFETMKAVTRRYSLIFNVYILNSPDFLPQFQYLENLKDCTHLSLIHFNWKRNDHQGQVPRKMVKFNQVLSQILSMVFSSKNMQLEVTILLSLYYEIL